MNRNRTLKYHLMIFQTFTPISMKMTAFWFVVALMTKAVDMLLRGYTTEGSELHTRRRENLKSHNMKLVAK